MMNYDSSDEDLIPLNGPEKIKDEEVDPRVISLFSETLIHSANLHNKVLEKVLGKFISRKAILQIEARIDQLSQLELRDEEIANIIADDEVPPSPLKHTRAELGEIAFRHLLKKHGLEGLAKKKEEEIEQLLLERKSFEMIQKIITE